ncbi:D-Ala-D-Ala carboxypeptidase family metallohydrolase [Caenimonas soli]|uniref:D-Ala-D-Ala carboxypeptidase family metallohydrolase n=1 Tax=Caenimonas soli TaxID=2735555 RepID=UPI001556C786|nr:D-Ala-D-Ala carboxypeptidase family metallohydrolase [Caenimonas soli]NPC54548.1 peptidase M15 [Caenimonas soli]
MHRTVIASLAIAPLLVGACSFLPVEAELEAFTQWARSAPVSEFEQYLATSNLDGVIPTRQLVRTATDWRKCGGPRFELPPRAQWLDVAKVLTLVAELKSRKILADFEAVSNFRNPELNACAGGARDSAHTQAFAIDVISRDGKIDEALLCDFWRTDGKAWDMGVSRYPSGRIHLDTSGYRTWGSDLTKGTSFCQQTP